MKKERNEHRMSITSAKEMKHSGVERNGFRMNANLLKITIETGKKPSESSGGFFGFENIHKVRKSGDD